MARYKMIARSNAREGLREQYNEWYDNHHIKDMLAVPGFISAERFVRAGEDGPHEYLTILEIETDDLQATMAELQSRSGTDAMTLTDALHVESVDLTLWRPYE